MGQITKADQKWLSDHGEQKESGWVCKATGAPINFIGTGRSIHSDLIPGAGSGEVRHIMHLYCSGCNPDFKPPQYGAPIQEGELLEVN